MRFFFYIFFCMSFAFCTAQNNVEKRLDSILNIENRDVKIEFLRNLKKSSPQENTKLYAKICHELGVQYYSRKEYFTALQNARKAISIRESIEGIETLDFHKSLNLSAACYRNLDDLQNELKDVHRLANAVEYTNLKLKGLLRLAEIHHEAGDYFKAMEYSNKILESYPIHKNEDKLVAAHFEKIIVYASMSSNDTTYLPNIKYHRQELEKRKDFFYPDDQVLLYNSMALIHRGYQNHEQALISYQKALENTTSETPERNLNSIYVNIGEMYSRLGASEKAKEYFQKVIATTDSINSSAAYNNLGFYHTPIIKQEIEYHQKAIRLLGIKADFSINSSFLKEIKDTPYKQELLSSLTDLSQAWIKLYKKNSDKKDLQQSLNIIYTIDDLISVMRLDSGTKASKLFWIEKGVNSYLEAVKICFLLDKPAEAFYFMEKNKSLYLLEQLGKIQLKNQYKIPNRVLEKEKNLNYEVLLAKSKLKTTPENTVVQNTYTKAEEKRFKFTDSLKKSFPEYYESNLKPKLITLKEFQHFLKEKHTNAIEYILGEKEGYGLWVHENKVHLFELKNYQKLSTDIAFLKNIYTIPSLSREEVEKYTKIGFDVFKTLFPWKGAIEEIQNKKLAIIPDGMLYNFPFDALIIGNKPVLKDNYLLHYTEISYLNSASVSQNLYNQETVSSNSYVGIAPVHFKSKGLVDLKNSESITKEIASLFPSSMLVKEKATREAFLNTSNGNTILHLNTHAGIDEKTKTPWLALSDTLISLEDIYIMNRSHDLVFLDACKTGNGKLQKGEGIESLSRAFFHAGSKSVIASQWNANEKATNEISVSFFKALKKGKSKSAALRIAKLDYLKRHELSNTFPYFWASLTLTGNSDALTETSYLYYAILIGSILLIIMLLYFRKRKRNSTL